MSIIMNWDEVVNYIKRRQEIFSAYICNVYHSKSDQRVLLPWVSYFLYNEKIVTPDWPDGHDFAVGLTHDLDKVFPYLNRMIMYIRRKISPSNRLNMIIRKYLINKLINLANPYNNIIEIAKLEDKYGVRSTFFVRASSFDIGWNYYPEDLEYELGYLKDNDFEIGLHASYYSSTDTNKLIHEKKWLEKVINGRVIGVRIHHLNLKIPVSYYALYRAGFKYDSSLGERDRPGFINGICYPFKPYDPKKDTTINLWEIPLAVMDTTFIGYMKIPPTQAFDIVKFLIRQVKKLHGVLVILWHNDKLIEKRYHEWSTMYEKIIRLVLSEKAWITTLKDIIYYWTKYYR